VLIKYARQEALRYKLSRNKDIPCEQLVSRLCELKQGYTQHGGLRPFAVSFLYASYDDDRGYQLFHSQASGFYMAMKACAAGRSGGIQGDLERFYTEDLDLREVSSLAIHVLMKVKDPGLDCKSLFVCFGMPKV